MRPGPPPQPTKLRLLRGNPGKRRLPSASLTPKTGCKLPTGASKAARSEWGRIAPELQRLGLLTLLDQSALLCYCEALADFKWATQVISREGRTCTAANGTKMSHPAMSVKSRAAEQIRQFAAEFGLTPAARSRIELTHAEEEDPDETRFFGPQPVPAPKPERKSRAAAPRKAPSRRRRKKSSSA